MAIEKMIFLNLVGKRNLEDDILEQLILSERLHLHLNYSEVYESNFVVHKFMLNHLDNMHLDTKGKDNTDSDKEQCQCEKLESLIKKLANDFQEEIVVNKKYLDPSYKIDDVERELMRIEEQVSPVSEKIRIKNTQIQSLLSFQNEIQYIVGKDIDFTKLSQLHYMEYQLGILSRDNNAHIKRNYENISAVIWRIGKKEQEDVYLILYPKEYKQEVERILKSVNWVPLNIPAQLMGTPSNMKEQITNKIQILEKEIQDMQSLLHKNKHQFISILKKCAARIAMEKQIKYCKQNIERDNHVFIISGWIPSQYKDEIDKVLGQFGDNCIAVYRNAQEIEEVINPPTKLHNHNLFKPFETIVQLYGLPAYNEFDPTLFLSITYWLMFGIMFGDIGQGFIFFIAGLVMSKKKPDRPAGGILTRLGISSMFFGVLYGSFFGLEDLPWLPHIVGSPLQGANIGKILIAGVIFGVAVLTISYILGIINAISRRDIEEGVFGKNGIVGYLFFINLVMTLAGLAGYMLVPITITIFMMIISLVVIIFKQPLAHIVQKIKPLHKEDVSSYYVESGFETIETILSTLSNTISFIRVGAFALNHAGLFLAFMVMAKMTSNVVLQVIILLIGNIIILVLEGLIVFIQGLRLEYYEMFSKYFRGGGKSYSPIKIAQER